MANFYIILMVRRGFGKAVTRLPQLVRQKAGMVQESKDGEFDTLALIFEKRVTCTQGMHADLVRFREAVKALLQHQEGVLAAFDAVISGGNEEERRVMKGLVDIVVRGKGEILDELDFVFTNRILKIFEELLAAQNGMQAKITKRNHKLLDYDRHKHSFGKLQTSSQKKANSISEERKMTQTEQQLHESEMEFLKYNDQLKEDLPRYLDIHERLMAPCLDSLIAFMKSFYAKQAEWATVASVLGNCDYASVAQEYETSMTPILNRISEMRLVNAAFGRASVKSLLAHKDSVSSTGSAQHGPDTSPIHGQRDKVDGEGLRHSASSPGPRSPIATSTIGAASPKLRSPTTIPVMAKAKSDLSEKQSTVPPPKPKAEPNSAPSLWEANNAPSTGNIPYSSSLKQYSQPSRAIYTEIYTMTKEQEAGLVGERASPVRGTVGGASNKVADLASKFGSVSLGASRSRESLPSAAIPVPPLSIKGKDPHVVALYSFEGGEPGDLPFQIGDKIRVIKKTESQNDWWTGELNGSIGIFPANYVRQL